MKTSKESNSLKINYQPVKSGEHTISLIAYVNFSRHALRSKRVDSKKSQQEQIRTVLAPPVKTYTPARVATGLRLHKAFWKNKKAVGEYAYINSQLRKFEKNVNLLYTAMIASKPELTTKEFGREIKIHITNKLKQGERILAGKSSSPKSRKKKDEELPEIVIPGYYGSSHNGIKTNLIEYIKDKIAYYSNTPYFEHKIGEGTVFIYTKFKSKLEEYKRETQKEFDLMTITLQECKDFINYFLERGKKENAITKAGAAYKHNQVEMWKKELKNFINKAKSSPDKIPVPLNPDEESWFNVSWEREDDPYLTQEQLDKLRALKFDEDEKHLEYVRDYFLLGCNCGASIIDLKNIKHIFFNNAEDWHFIYMRTKTFKKQITKIRIHIPVRQNYIVDLYNKYSAINKKLGLEPGFNFTLSDVKFNKHIKKICLRAGLNDLVERWTQNPVTGKPEPVKVRRANGKMETPKLWETVSSKCMRKTFASNEARVYLTPLSVIKGWTQHSSEASLMNYIMLTSQDYFDITTELKAKLNLLKELQNEKAALNNRGKLKRVI